MTQPRGDGTAATRAEVRPCDLSRMVTGQGVKWRTLESRERRKAVRESVK